jgi:pimeloyl-ACP methyl ester carboxylesterase
MDPARFEWRRMALFAKHGFVGTSRWFADQAGRRTYALVHGDADCPTVLVHGGMAQASDWALIAGRLQGSVVIPDRPGCGLSYPIDYRGSDYRQAAADWLRDLADGLGARKIDLVGASMGGFFALAFALANPERVRRLVLCGAPAGLDRGLPLLIRLMGNPVFGPLMARQRIADIESLRTRVFDGLLMADADRLPSDFLEIALAGATLPGVQASAYSMHRRVTTLRGFRNELLLRDEVTKLATPTLFLWGDSDGFAPPSSGGTVAAAMPAARLEVIKDAGHLPHLDAPATVATAINRFFAAGRRGDGPRRESLVAQARTAP